MWVHKKGAEKKERWQNDKRLPSINEWGLFYREWCWIQFYCLYSRERKIKKNQEMYKIYFNGMFIIYLFYFWKMWRTKKWNCNNSTFVKKTLKKKTVLLLKHMKVWLWMLNYLSNSSPLGLLISYIKKQMNNNTFKKSTNYWEKANKFSLKRKTQKLNKKLKAYANIPLLCLVSFLSLDSSFCFWTIFFDTLWQFCRAVQITISFLNSLKRTQMHHLLWTCNLWWN